MKARMIAHLSVGLLVFAACGMNDKRNQTKKSDMYTDHLMEGVWVRMGATGPVAFNFRADGRVEGDFGQDNSVDVVAEYTMSNDTIRFRDMEGQSCAGWGMYKVYRTPYYMAFDLIDDMCHGRIKTVMGFWTTTGYKEALGAMGAQLASDPQPGLYRSRGRVYMAIGDMDKARADFDAFIARDTTDARVYVNRAGTRFPRDMEGVFSDCSKAIQLDPSNKSAWFLRGLARYEMGDKEVACRDFARAIELGFVILRQAEQAKCAEYWDP